MVRETISVSKNACCRNRTAIMRRNMKHAMERAARRTIAASCAKVSQIKQCRTRARRETTQGSTKNEKRMKVELFEKAVKSERQELNALKTSALSQRL